MGSKGFVFSLDAFVALLLVLIAIASIIALSSTPKNFYMGLEQAQDLAKDTLSSMATTPCGTTCSAPGITYLEAAALGGSEAQRAIWASAEQAIPQQYGFKFVRFNALTDATSVLYDSQFNSPADSPRHGRPQRKLSAVASTFMSYYETSPAGLKSPFCYMHCSGVPIESGGPACMTPCDAPRSLFDDGSPFIGQIRLIVYT